ncbi:MAG: CDP-alcohol phosphatidyltransferase family protein [Alsobacter sp.]
MFDARLRRIVDPVLLRAAIPLARRGVHADHVTGVSLVIGIACAAAVATGAFPLALALLAISRISDGLDGVVASLTRRTPRGGFLDIVSDFAFYGAVPFGFALWDPGLNALSASFLLFAFYVNGATFLAYAAVAARQGHTDEPRGPKSIHYTAGLAEGGETIAVFAMMMLWPAVFPSLAWGFGALCLVSASARVLIAWRAFP